MNPNGHGSTGVNLSEFSDLGRVELEREHSSPEVSHIARSLSETSSPCAEELRMAIDEAMKIAKGTGLYVEITEVEQKQRLDFPENIIREWRDVVYPNWITVSQFSTKTRLHDFVKVVALTALRPVEFAKVPLHAIVSDKFINIEDAIAAKLACRLYSDEDRRSNLVKADWYLNTEEGDLSMYYAKTTRISDSIFASLLKSAGPEKVLASEQALHSFALIPAGLFLGYTVPTLSSLAANEAEAYYSKEWVYNAYMILTVVNHSFYLMSFVLSGIWSVMSFFCSSSDRLSAAYFSISPNFRFLGFLLMYVALCITGPLAGIVSSFQSSPHNDTYLMSWILIPSFILTNFIIGITIVVLWNTIHDILRYRDPHHRISCAEDIIFETHDRTRWSLMISKFLGNAHGRVYEVLRNIGIFRKKSIAETSKTAFMESVIALTLENESGAFKQHKPDKPPTRELPTFGAGIRDVNSRNVLSGALFGSEQRSPLMEISFPVKGRDRLTSTALNMVP